MQKEYMEYVEQRVKKYVGMYHKKKVGKMITNIIICQ